MAIIMSNSNFILIFFEIHGDFWGQKRIRAAER